MEHQNWDTIIFNNEKEKVAKKERQAATSKYVPPPETVKMEAPKSLGQLICQGRTIKGKTQKVFATELGIATSILSRWENNKETPTNAEIAKIEKAIGIKLPRNKKIKVDAN